MWKTHEVQVENMRFIHLNGKRLKKMVLSTKDSQKIVDENDYEKRKISLGVNLFFQYFQSILKSFAAFQFFGYFINAVEYGRMILISQEFADTV